MRLEKELKMAMFKDEWHRARINLLFTAGWLSNEIKEFLDPFGITEKQFNILRILRGHRGETPLSILEIRGRMIDKMSDASRLIDRLHKKELIRKQPCSSDKRTTRVMILEDGLNLLQQIDEALPKINRVGRNLTESEISTLNELLEKFRELPEA